MEIDLGTSLALLAIAVGVFISLVGNPFKD